MQAPRLLRYQHRADRISRSALSISIYNFAKLRRAASTVR